MFFYFILCLVILVHFGYISKRSKPFLKQEFMEHTVTCVLLLLDQVGPGIPVGSLAPLVPVPRPVVAPPKVNPTVIQAAPTVYSSPPVKKQEVSESG